MNVKNAALNWYCNHLGAPTVGLTRSIGSAGKTSSTSENIANPETNHTRPLEELMRPMYLLLVM